MIRDATIEDLPDIVRIYNAAIPGRLATADLEPVTIDSRRAWFTEHSSTSRPLWILAENGEVRAWLSFQSFYGRPAYHATSEVSVYVAPLAQRRGYGGQLLAQAIDWSPSIGLKTLLAFIFGHNEPSLALFRRLGFDTWARLPNVAELDGIERDVLILGRRIA
jgi:L-amino acid N-acyltransferase YncA